MMQHPLSISSPILAFVLTFTKYAGEHKVPVLEWALAWITVVVFGLRYLIDYARLRWKLYQVAKQVVGKSAEESLCDCVLLCPLAHTRDELSRGIEERWERLRSVLFRASSIPEHGLETKESVNGSGDASTTNEPSSTIADMAKHWTDEDWIRIVRSNLDVRREASHLMFALSGDQHQDTSRENTIVLSKLRRLWPRFLELPSSVVGDGISGNCDTDGHSGSDSNSNIDPSYDISLIVPMYKERITDISYTLHRAFGNCRGDPKKIQVIVVHAESSPVEGTDAKDSNDNFFLRQHLLLLHEQQQQQQKNRQKTLDVTSESTSTLTSFWGELKVVTIPFGEGGGRGKTLNVGAGRATAPLLTFLHADTMVPLGWDEQIKGALRLHHPPNTTAEAREGEGENTFFPHACAFTMAIDIDIDIDIDDDNKTQTPGLLGAEWLGVLRCHCGLPYGDSVLSFSRPMFDYMGGYPEQPLMEDYEVMDWLRLRSVLLSTIYRMTTAGNIHSDSSNDSSSKTDSSDSKGGVGVTRREGLVLLRDRARCSPRRWKKYGVAYTSLVNAICIFRYRSKATAEELFDFYYHCNSSASQCTPAKVKTK